MNLDTIKTILALKDVIEACFAGGQMQFKVVGFQSIPTSRWKDVDLANCTFSFPTERYRLKPEPEVLYCNKTREGSYFAYRTEEEASLWISRTTNSMYNDYEYVAKKFVEAE
jgi:hypothetical protein